MKHHIFRWPKIFFCKNDFQFAQLEEELEPLIAIIFNRNTGHNVGIQTKIGLREVILLDRQSTMDIFCNQDLVEKTAKSKTKMRLNSNSGTMTVSHQSTVNGYHNIVWFIKNSINNIISLINLCLNYLVTYRSDDMIFIAHK